MNYKHNPRLTPHARSLRKEMTREERHLWYDFLREYPVRFLRQKVVDSYILDFYCSAAGLAIELDGSQHYSSDGQEYDIARDEHLKNRGIRVVRIPNNEIFTNFSGVCAYIDNLVQESLHR